MRYRSLQILCLIQISFTCISGFPIKNAAEAVMYLKKYGYVVRTPKFINNQVSSADDPQSAYKALKMFQHVMHLNESGVLDSNTLQMMNAKRCGNADITPTSSRQKRFVVNEEGRRWSNPNITYAITRYPSDTSLNRHIINQLTTRAFQMWQEASGSHLRFSNASDSSSTSTVDIDIRFVTGPHNDNDPFDGPGETLAHAFPPGEGLYGDIHVDEEEDWDLEGKFDGSNYFWVIVHEIGHSLGLSHSMNGTAVMTPMEPEFDPDLKLETDDIRGLRSLYSLPEPEETTEGKIDNGSVRFEDATIHPRRNFLRRCVVRPDPCSEDFRINAATVLENDQIYLFSGCYAIHVSKNGVIMGNHRSQSKFRGLLSDRVDAAVTTPSGFTYFFEGNEIRRYRNFNSDSERGRRAFSGIPLPIDAAFRWKDDVYVIKGNMFFLLKNYPAPMSFPGVISKWGITDDGIDAALVFLNRVYLFRQGHFWTLVESNGEFQVDRPTPRSTRTEFLRC